MKGQKLLKACSVVMILACLFGLVSGGLGISDVSDVKPVSYTHLTLPTN